MNTKTIKCLIVSLLATAGAFGQSLPYTPLSIDLSGISYKDEPSVVKTQDGRVHVFVRHNNDQLHLRTLNGTTWSSWQSLGGVCTSGPSAVAIGNTIHVFVRSADNAIHTRSWNEITWWGDWQTLGGSLSSAPSAVANVWPNYVYVYAKGADGAIWQQAWNGSAWLGWSSIGGNLASGPSVVSPSPGKIFVFARGADGAIWQHHYNGSAWTGWQSLGGNFTGPPSAVANVWVNHVHLHARAMDNTIWQQSHNGSSWGSWGSLGGNLTGNPMAYSLAEGRLNVLAKNGSQIWQRIFAGWSSSLNWLDWSTWPKRSLTVCAKADFGAVGDGIADDSNALQMALDYLAAHNIADRGGCLALPAGTYKITRRLNYERTTARQGMNQGITIRGNDSQGTARTTIYSASTEGALFFKVNDDNGHFYQFGVRVQDLEIRAGATSAGAAIDIQRMNVADTIQSVVPLIKNVAITTDAAARHFRWGIVMRKVLRPSLTDVRITGNRSGTDAGIWLERFYNLALNNCHLSGAQYGIFGTKGGEENNILNSVITEADTGMHLHIDPYNYTGPSSLGGAIVGCDIKAWIRGVTIDHKGHFVINDNRFTRLGTSSDYLHLLLSKVHHTIVTDNKFLGSGNTGIEVADGSLSSGNTIAYNDFGILPTAVRINSGVRNTMILDNLPASAFVSNSGTGTHIERGATRGYINTPTRRPAYSNPIGFNGSAQNAWTRRPAPNADNAWRVIVPWSGMTRGTVINVTDYGADGLDTADDTTAIQNALAALRTHLNGSSAQGTLYFPAGLYLLSSRLDLTQGAANWQNVSIVGDGSHVTGIRITGIQGFVRIDGNLPTIRLHGLRLDPWTANPSRAIDIMQRGGTVNGVRSLLAQDVSIFKNTGAGRHFHTGFHGTGLVRPLFQDMIQRAVGDDRSTTCGIYLAGGYGFDWQGGSESLINGGKRAIEITSLGGEVTFRGGGFVGGERGLWIDANNGFFSHNATHIDSPFNLELQKASHAVFINTLTIAGPQINDHNNGTTLDFRNCADLRVRDNILAAAHETPRPQNRHVWLRQAPLTNNYWDVRGNAIIYNGFGGYGIQVEAQNYNGSIHQNRFFADINANQPFTSGMVDIVNNEPSTMIWTLPRN